MGDINDLMKLKPYMPAKFFPCSSLHVCFLHVDKRKNKKKQCYPLCTQDGSFSFKIVIDIINVLVLFVITFSVFHVFMALTLICTFYSIVT